MTVKEFSNQFDIHYNNISTNSAPNIDEYEKSVYLTKAQLQLVKNVFTPKGNKYGEGFEKTTKRRADLENLVSNYVGIREAKENLLNKLSNDSKFFKIPDDTFLIVFEQVFSDDATLNCKELIKPLISSNNPSPVETINKSVKVKKLGVKPITHDEYTRQEENPFKKPNEDLVWRVSYGDEDFRNLRSVELISPYKLYMYQIRYVKIPNPIILTDLHTLYPGENLSINGKYKPATSELLETFHDEILDRAVELAKGDYEFDNIQIRTQQNLRNE